MKVLDIAIYLLLFQVCGGVLNAADTFHMSTNIPVSDPNYNGSYANIMANINEKIQGGNVIDYFTAAGIVLLSLPAFLWSAISSFLMPILALGNFIDNMFYTFGLGHLPSGIILGIDAVIDFMMILAVAQWITSRSTRSIE